ncbi:MAG TPA: hypothetical protein VFC53_05900 [Dehalococcoidia bacterium]|nr:hypothetical protein [Dehalococcoidia bacterium]
MLEIDPADLGTLELAGAWVPYIDLGEGGFLPTRVKIVNDEYAFRQSFNIQGHSAVMPQAIRELRAGGKKPVVIERGDRYYVFVSPPA